MRDYGKVSPKFWIGATGKALRKHGPHAQLVGLYLMTNPHANMLGMYYLPITYIAHETGLGLEGASKGLESCIEAEFCAYDEDAEVVWVYEMASYQVAEQLKPGDNRCAGVQNEYSNMQDNQHLYGFFQKYQRAFHMTSQRGIEIPLQAPCKPLASQEQDQEQEQEQKQEQKQEQEQHIVERRGAPPDRDMVPRIFAFWQEVMNSPNSKLDAKRIDIIRKALKMGYDPRDLCEAIRGCAMIPHNMGENENRTKYNGLNLIFRSADNIDRFIARAKQPEGQAASRGKETIEQANERVMRELGFGPEADNDDGNTIDMEAA